MGPTIRAWVNYLIENKWLGKPLMLKADEAMEQILEVEKVQIQRDSGHLSKSTTNTGSYLMEGLGKGLRRKGTEGWRHARL